MTFYVSHVKKNTKTNVLLKKSTRILNKLGVKKCCGFYFFLVNKLSILYICGDSFDKVVWRKRKNEKEKGKNKQEKDAS